MKPETKYAMSGDVAIAYQVVGDAPRACALAPGWPTTPVCCGGCPASAGLCERLASFSRLILFDNRGTGLSDRVPPTQFPTLEQRMDDVRAVMDAVGSERATLC